MKLWRNLSIVFGVFTFGLIMELFDVNKKYLAKEVQANTLVTCIVMFILFAILTFYFWNKYNKTKRIN